MLWFGREILPKLCGVRCRRSAREDGLLAPHVDLRIASQHSARRQPPKFASPIAASLHPRLRACMLKHRLIHPEINAILGRAGHHSKVLIADGNYPASSTLGPRAELVSLNLAPGIVTCAQVLEALLSAVPVEAAYTMMYETTGPYALEADPPVWADYRQIIQQAGLKLELQPIEKWEFYKTVQTPDHVLTIQTADQHRFANLLLAIGVRMD